MAGDCDRVAVKNVDVVIGMVGAAADAADRSAVAEVAGGVGDGHMLGVAAGVGGTVCSKGTTVSVAGCTTGSGAPYRRNNRTGPVGAGVATGRRTVTGVAAGSMFGNRCTNVIIRYFNGSVGVIGTTTAPLDRPVVTLAAGGVVKSHVGTVATGGGGTTGAVEDACAVMTGGATDGLSPYRGDYRAGAVGVGMAGCCGAGAAVGASRVFGGNRIAVAHIHRAIKMAVTTAAVLDRAVMAEIARRTGEGHMFGMAAGGGRTAGAIKGAAIFVTGGTPGRGSPHRTDQIVVSVGADMAGCAGATSQGTFRRLTGEILAIAAAVPHTVQVDRAFACAGSVGKGTVRRVAGGTGILHVCQ